MYNQQLRYNLISAEEEYSISMGQNIHLNSKQAFSFCDEVWLPVLENNVPDILPGYFVSNYGRMYTSRRNLILNYITDKDGYIRITLRTSKPPGKGLSCCTQKSVARIVKQAFDPIENPSLYDVHHIDRNPINNHISNLQWISPQEHQKLTKETWPKGKESKLYGPNGSGVKLTSDQVIAIKNRIINGEYTSLAKIAKEYDVNETCIWTIVHNVNWEDFGPSISVDDLRVSTGLTNQEIEAICNYFETHDINNRTLYPSKQSLIVECYYALNLNQKYGDDVEAKRKLITSILLKEGKFLNRITDKYSYSYNNKIRKSRY